MRLTSERYLTACSPCSTPPFYYPELASSGADLLNIVLMKNAIVLASLASVFAPLTVGAGEAGGITATAATPMANARRPRVQFVPSTQKSVPPPKVELPPLPQGVEELKFDDFFKTPVGPRGLEFTDRIKSLDGKKVRIVGYQVVEAVTVDNDEPVAPGTDEKERLAAAMRAASVPGRLLLAPAPETINSSHYGLCDDLPPQVLYVTVPEAAGKILPQHRGPLLLTGTIEIGNKPEADERLSSVRMKLDPTPASRAPLPQPTSAQPSTVAPLQPETAVKNTAAPNPTSSNK